MAIRDLYCEVPERKLNEVAAQVAKSKVGAKPAD